MQGLHKQQRSEAGSWLDQDQQWKINYKTNSKADGTPKSVKFYFNTQHFGWALNLTFLAVRSAFQLVYSTISSGIEYLIWYNICPLAIVHFFSPSGKRTPPVIGQLPLVPGVSAQRVPGRSTVYRSLQTKSQKKYPPVNSNFAGNMTSIYGLQLSRLTNDICGFPFRLLTYALLVCFLRTSHMFLCRGKCFWFKSLAIFLVSMIDLRIRSTRKRRMCSCPHLRDFKKADGLKVFRKVHAHFVCCGSREARKRKVYTL